jgi:hypothetical protein
VLLTLVGFDRAERAGSSARGADDWIFEISAGFVDTLSSTRSLRIPTHRFGSSRRSTQGRFRRRQHPGGHRDRVGEPGDEPAVTLKTWIAVGGGLLGAFLAVLNIQITNASLPYIEGGIGTGGVYGTWISTAHLIGEIIVIPLTDFLSRVFSLRRYLIVNTALFLLFSALCGQS